MSDPVYQYDNPNHVNLKDHTILEGLYRWYGEREEMWRQFILIAGEKCNISLRIMDWFVTNYSKQKNIQYQLDESTFNVFNAYKTKLRSDQKKRFDPFRRQTKIKFKSPIKPKLLEDGTPEWDEWINTTLGQLNFFKWALENKVVDYVRDNITDIESDLGERNNKTHNRERKKNLQEGMKPMRRPLSTHTGINYVVSDSVMVVTL